MQGNEELFGLLGQLDRTKPYGTALFDALAKVTISIGVEAVCLRLATNKHLVDDYMPDQKPVVMLTNNTWVEVYLTQRSQTDTAYPSEWHCPGSVLRPTENFGDVFDRLANREFGGKISSTRFVANANHPTEARGHFISVVYLCTLDESDGLRGKWFPVDQLPEKTVECHRYRIIPAAVGAFVAENTKICW